MLERVRRWRAGWREGILRANAYTESGCFLEAQVVRDLHLDIPLRRDIFGKRAILRVDGISPMHEASDPISFFERLGNLASYFFYDASII